MVGQRRSRFLVAGGLGLTAMGFVLAGLAPGAGPRLVRGGAEFGSVYAPPVIVGLVIGVVAVLVARLSAWWPIPVGGIIALVLLVGSVTVGFESVVYRLARPGDGVPFVGDLAQVLGEVVAVLGGLTIARRHRQA